MGWPPLPPGTIYAGAKTRKGVIDEITSAINSLPPEAEVDVIESAAYAAVAHYFALGATVSVAHAGGDFFDFAIGSTVNQVMAPIVDSTIIQPLKQILKRAFRFDAPSARILVAMADAGLIDEDLMRDALVSSGVEDKFIAPLIAYARAQRQLTLGQLHEQVETAQETLAVYPLSLTVDRAGSLAAKIENELGALEETQALQDERQMVARESRLAGRLEATINAFDTAATDKIAATALARISVYSNAAKRYLLS